MSAAIGSVAVGLLAAPAFAETADAAAAPAVAQLDEVLVTARRREENNQDVPAAVTALGAAALQQQQISSPTDLQRITPSLSIGGGNSVYGTNLSNYSIRGLGQALFGGSSVISYFGEAPYGPTGPGMPFFDISSVQVLKGPQGTLFGRASVGGAVVITPAAPTLDTFYGDASAKLGNMGRADFNLVANLPIATDKVGLRIALNRTHLDGWVDDLTTGKTLSENNSQSARISLKVKPFEWLENDTVFNYFNYDSSLMARILVGANLNLSSLNRPASGFAAVCAQAIGAGLANDLVACENQRVSLEAAQRNALAAEVARTSAGGSQLRKFTGGTAYPEEEKAVSQTYVNTTQVHLPDMGLFTINLKNIFSFQENKNLVNGDWNGTPYNVNSSAFCASPFSPNTGCASIGQFINGKSASSMGAFNKFYTDEFQVNGSIDHDFIIWLLGYYYQDAPVPYDTYGSTNLNLTFGGVGTPNFGPLSATPMNIGGHDREKAYFGQFTMDLSKFHLDNVHLTAGYRRTQSDIVRTTAAAVVNYPSGLITPGAISTVHTTGHGPSWNVALDWKATPDLLLYAKRSRGYKPGGQNSSVGASSVPGYVAVYEPESVIDTEIGAKWDFTVLGMRGRLNADVFHDSYTNIQRGTNAISAQGNNFAFTANVAAARLQGLELEGFIRPIDRLTLSATYSYLDAKYTRWRGSDPLGAAPAGSIIDLSNNPFANAPKNQASATAEYDLPLDSNIGDVRASVTVYGQSKSYLTDQATRNIEVYGPGVASWVSEPGYVAANARIDWRHVYGQPFDAALYVKNLTNKIYAVGGGISLNSVGTAMKVYNEPREVGVELTYHFGEH